MRVKISKEDLIKGLNTIQNAVDTRATLPILSNILIETYNNKLQLTATDLNLGITCELPVDIQEQGAVAITAKRFIDIIKELSEEEIEIIVKKNNSLTIETKNCQFKLMGLPKEEFPKLPEFKDKEVINFHSETLKQLLSLVVFAVSYDETRYILNGVLFQNQKDTLFLVATDGRRLAITSEKLTRIPNKDINIIVPAKTVQELIRNLTTSEQTLLVLGTNQIMFQLNGVSIISRLIEGEFPDYRSVIPPVAEQKIKVERQALLQAVRRAAILATPDYQAVKMEVFKNKLVVSKATPDIGESREELNVEYAGKEIVVGFNPAYIIDVLRNLSDEIVMLEITAADKPAVIRKENYLYIVLPMRLG